MQLDDPLPQRPAERPDTIAIGDRSDWHLMISGSIQPGHAAEPVPVRRAMVILDCSGCPLGRVAGILVDAAARGVAILLGDYATRPVYRWIDPALVTAVDETIHLQIAAAEIAQLPAHQATWQAEAIPQPDNERLLP